MVGSYLENHDFRTILASFKLSETALSSRTEGTTDEATVEYIQLIQAPHRDSTPKRTQVR